MEGRLCVVELDGIGTILEIKKPRIKAGRSAQLESAHCFGLCCYLPHLPWLIRIYYRYFLQCMLICVSSRGSSQAPRFSMQNKKAFHHHIGCTSAKRTVPLLSFFQDRV